MIVQLQNDVKLGDRVSVQPDVLIHGASAEIMPKNLTGTVISIPKHRRFAVVQYGEGDKNFCESVPIAPPEERLAHRDPEPKAGRLVGSRGKARPAITQRLQKRDWSDMTSDQIAAVLGTDAHVVTSAINALRKRGIDIPYKKRVAEGWGARKAAAGEPDSDDGKEN